MKNPFTNDIKRYSIAERVLFFLFIILTLLVIGLSQILIETEFGRASLTFAMLMLGSVAVLRVLRKWGPRD